MNKKIAQIRYYGNKNKNNQPSSIRLNDLISGEVFKEFYPISQINIQGDSGTAFHINHDVNTVLIGPSGVYNLDLEGFSSIEDLSFKTIKVDSIPLIIDLIYG